MDLEELDGEHYSRLLAASECDTAEDIVVEMRQYFLELLNEAYAHVFAVGDLDYKTDGFYAFDALLQSVALATVDVDHQGKLHDYEYTDIFPFVETFKSFVHRKWRQWRSRWTNQPKASRRGSTRSFQHLQHRVLRTLAFIRAHVLAEEKLRSTLDRFLASSSEGQESDGLRKAVETVVSECQTQVKAARRFLDDLPSQETESILSHFVANLLLRKLAEFVEKSASDGVLLVTEARRYFQLIDQYMDDAKTCDVPCSKVKHANRQLSTMVEETGPPSSEFEDFGQRINED
jgi:hypothetical protein